MSAQAQDTQPDTDPEHGLRTSTAEQRLSEYGPNAIEEEGRHPVLWFLSHFWGPIPWMLEVAVVLAAVAQRWEDMAVILVMLLINGGVGFWHDRKAANAIAALKEQLAPQARVIRDGERRTIAARELVPGDLVILRMGDVVPADVELLEDQTLQVDESALTGESLPVSKEGGAVCHSGTVAKRGEARGVVVATGRQTRFARTVEMVESAEEQSHFQRAVLRIGWFLISITGVIVAVIVAVGLGLRGDPWDQVLMFALVLTIAGIPQALPAVLTVTMTVGASRLARMKAIVSRLAALEEVAGLHVLCADKTGTLTRNQLEVQEPVVLDAGDARDLLVAAALTCRDDQEDPIDRAVLAALDDPEALNSYSVETVRPFDPTRKRAEADVRGPSGSATVAKGAPQAILDLVGADDDRRRDIAERVDDLGAQGFRALAVARRDGDGPWQVLGILPLLDPPRADSAEVIAEARAHGIDVRMVTGDHAAIAGQVAGQVGLGQDIPVAEALFGTDETEIPDDKVAAAERADGFAQVTPGHKFAIIKAFQKDHRIVGMTGDGVNDAPALKQADVGIAVADATDAARAAADLVLTRQGLGVITHAVEEARRIFERMTAYATFRITETMRVLIFIAVTILAFDFYPVTPIMVVLLAILNDIAIMTIASDNTRTADHPVRWNMGRVITIAGVLSVVGVVFTFGLLWYGMSVLGLAEEGPLQTMMFLKLLVAGHLMLFLTRNEGWAWSRPLPSLALFGALEITQILGTVVALVGFLVPALSWQLVLLVWAYSVVEMLVANGAKVLTFRLMNRSRAMTAGTAAATH